MDHSPDISDYALLGDCQGAALVSRDGSVDWWCPSRFDAPSVFARILDRERGGHWFVRPVGSFETRREYVGDTFGLRTTFTTEGGSLIVTDVLALGPGEREHEIGFNPPHALLRQLEALDGDIEVEVDFQPRPEYGLLRPHAERTARGVEISGGADRFLLTCDRELTLDGGRAHGSFLLAAGESTAMGLQHHSAIDPQPAPLDVRAAIADTIAGWQSWADMHRYYDGPYQGQVMRSALVLQALTYQPTGAIVAAPTTSLPEVVGGSDNWDYRFAWLRDGSLTLKALWVAACPHEAERFFDWMAQVTGPAIAGGHVQIMYGVGGEHDLTEHELEHLSGHRASTPVRVGNGAWTQKQLDVLGEVLECAWVLREQLKDMRPRTQAFLAALADTAAESWEQKDAGIWEGREGERHYVTSKLMCWVALDRAVKLASQLGDYAHPEKWEIARDEVRAAILEKAWSESAGAYGGAFGSHHLDAGVLLMPLVGFVEADDERMLATIDAIERDLSHGGLVQRWTGAGDEGAFVICSYWLSACRALVGDVDRARELFEKVTSHANDLGLLSEEIDIRDGALLGNFPQGFSHIGLINAAWAIGQAQSGNDGGR